MPKDCICWGLAAKRPHLLEARCQMDACATCLLRTGRVGDRLLAKPVINQSQVFLLQLPKPKALRRNQLVSVLFSFPCVLSYYPLHRPTLISVICCASSRSNVHIFFYFTIFTGNAECSVPMVFTHVNILPVIVVGCGKCVKLPR